MRTFLWTTTWLEPDAPPPVNINSNLMFTGEIEILPEDEWTIEDPL